MFSYKKSLIMKKSYDKIQLSLWILPCSPHRICNIPLFYFFYWKIELRRETWDRDKSPSVPSVWFGNCSLFCRLYRLFEPGINKGCRWRLICTVRGRSKDANLRDTVGSELNSTFFHSKYTIFLNTIIISTLFEKDLNK